MKQDKQSQASLEELSNQDGLDYILEHMKSIRLPLTRQNYLDMADLKEPKETDWEFEALLPRSIRKF